MNISWNARENCFELSFDRANFQDDLDKAKGSGFKTTGPPDWVWYSNKVKVLRKLRKNKPLSGLTISSEARVKFEEWSVEEDKRDALKKDIKKIKKGRPKTRVEETHSKIQYETRYQKYVPPAPPSLLCMFCYDPVYGEYERIMPPTCIWCEKTIGDLQDE